MIENRRYGIKDNLSVDKQESDNFNGTQNISGLMISLDENVIAERMEAHASNPVDMVSDLGG